MAFTPFVETDQPTMAAFNEKFQEAINAAIELGLTVEVGTYVGTGTCGVNNKNSLTFFGVPKLLIVSYIVNQSTPNGGNIIWFSGINYTIPCNKDTSTSIVVEANNNVLNWWATGVTSSSSTGIRDQMNTAGVTYSYFAITNMVV